MVEAGANEIPEAEILDALDIAHEEIKKLCAAQRELAEKAGKAEDRGRDPAGRRRACYEQIKASHGAALDAATQVEDKLERQDATKAVEDADPRAVLRRPRGRDLRRVPRQRPARVRQAREDDHPRAHRRPEEAPRRPRRRARSARSRSRSASLPRTHGSALFTRGQTQALQRRRARHHAEEMRLDTLGLETNKRYFHHYNFPPFSVGEAGFMRGPKRRDIGHGALAERALVPMIPSTRRSSRTRSASSRTSSSPTARRSMASVCGSSLSLMDAGVPIKRAGRGHRDGPDQGGRRLHRPHRHRRRRGPPRRHGLQGRRHRARASPRCRWTSRSRASRSTSCATRSPRPRTARDVHPRQDGRGRSTPRASSCRKYAPRISTIQIDPEKIGLLIGKGGETIRGLPEEFESQIDVNDEGQVLVYAANGELRRRAGRAHPLDDQGGRGRRRVHRQGRQDDDVRRLRRARQGHRRPAAHLQRRRRAAASTRSRRCSTRATRSTSAWSRSTASAAASACASPTTRTSPARPSRSSPRVGTGDAGGGGGRGRAARGRDRGGRDRPRRPRPRPRPRPRARPRARPRPRPRPRLTRRSRAGPRSDAEHRITDARLGRAGRHGGHALRALRGARLLDRHRLARRDRGRGRALAPARAHAVPRHRALRLAGDRPALRRDGRRAQRRHRQGDAPRSTRACSTSTSSARST